MIIPIFFCMQTISTKETSIIIKSLKETAEKKLTLLIQDLKHQNHLKEYDCQALTVDFLISGCFSELIFKSNLEKEDLIKEITQLVMPFVMKFLRCQENETQQVSEEIAKEILFLSRFLPSLSAKKVQSDNFELGYPYIKRETCNQKVMGKFNIGYYTYTHELDSTDMEDGLPLMTEKEQEDLTTYILSRLFHYDNSDIIVLLVSDKDLTLDNIKRYFVFQNHIDYHDRFQNFENCSQCEQEYFDENFDPEVSFVRALVYLQKKLNLTFLKRFDEDTRSRIYFFKKTTVETSYL